MHETIVITILLGIGITLASVVIEELRHAYNRARMRSRAAKNEQ